MDVAARIVEDLNAWVPQAAPLAGVCADAETRIGRSVIELVRVHVDGLAKSEGLRSRWSSDRSFYLDGRLYEIRITEHPTDTAIIQIAIIRIAGDRQVASGDEPIRFAIDGHGRYGIVGLSVDAELSQIEDALALDLQAHYSTAYRWLEAHVVGELVAVEYRAAIELYMEVRSVLPAHLAEVVALYGMDRKEAFYLLDPRAIQTAFIRAIERRANIDASPIELTTMLVTQLLDPDETVAQASLAENRPLLLNLEESRYAATKLNVAEGMFYDTPSVMSYPLVRGQKVQLTAIYPANLQEQIAPELRRITDRCSEILGRHGRFVHQRVYGHDHGLSPGLSDRLAELLGRFAGGFTESLR